MCGSPLDGEHTCSPRTVTLHGGDSLCDVFRGSFRSSGCVCWPAVVSRMERLPRRALWGRVPGPPVRGAALGQQLPARGCVIVLLLLLLLAALPRAF